MTAKVVSIEFKGLHKAFGQLRSADQRSIVAAYRFGQVVDALHKTGYSWMELGEEVDRSWLTVKLYATLYNKYDDEKELLETAEAMRTYAVARLAGNTSLVPAVFVFHCMNCGSFEIRKERKTDDEVDSTPSAPYYVPFKPAIND